MVVSRHRLLPRLVLMPVLVAGCGSGESGGSPSAASSSSSPSASVQRAPSGRESAARALIGSPRSHLFSWAYAPGGGVLGVWSRGWSQYPDQAIALRTPSGADTARTVQSASSIVGEVPHGWILATTRHDRTRLSLIGEDAIPRRLATPAALLSRPRQGDVALMKGGGPVVFRPSTGLLYTVARSPVAHPTGAYVTDSGSLLLAGQSDSSATWATFDGHHRRSGTFPSAETTESVAGAGNTIAVVLGGHLVNGVDATPIEAVAISDNSGRTWRIREVPAGVVEALSTVVMPSGTIFITTGTGQLLRIRPGHAVEVVPRDRTPISLSKAGSRLYLLSVTPSHRYVLHFTTDEGRTWTRAPVPGRSHGQG
jgi:hypothetical protein